VLHPGEGVEGRIDGALWRLGRRCFVDPAAAADDGGLWLSREGVLEARFDVDDAPRDDAAATVTALARDGMAPRILSGDAEARVAALGGRLGIDAAHRQSRLSPEGKLAALRTLQAAGHRVLMVGDGVNDAAVLAAADVSAAMASGASLAQRQADLVLLGSRLEPLRYAMRLAGQTQAIVRQNIVWAIAYNALMLPLAALGIVGPGLAALGMALSSLAVTANAWRIGRGLEGGAP
jgi:Cu2+-exporting ATPase